MFGCEYKPQNREQKRSDRSPKTTQKTADIRIDLRIVLIAFTEVEGSRSPENPNQ